MPRVTSRPELELAPKNTLWTVLESLRSEVEAHLEGQDLDQDIF